MFGIADVARNQDDLAPLTLYQRFDFGCVVVLVQIGDREIRAFTGIGDRDRASDTCLLYTSPSPRD